MALTYLNADGSVRDDLAEQMHRAYPDIPLTGDVSIERWVTVIKERVAQGLPPTISEAQRRLINEVSVGDTDQQGSAA